MVCNPPVYTICAVRPWPHTLMHRREIRHQILSSFNPSGNLQLERERHMILFEPLIDQDDALKKRHLRHT